MHNGKGLVRQGSKRNWYSKIPTAAAADLASNFRQICREKIFLSFSYQVVANLETFASSCAPRDQDGHRWSRILLFRSSRRNQACQGPRASSTMACSQLSYLHTNLADVAMRSERPTRSRIRQTATVPSSFFAFWTSPTRDTAATSVRRPTAGLSY